MRKLFVWMLVAGFAWTGAFGKPVGRQAAMEAARVFLSGRGYTELIAMDVVQERRSWEGVSTMYIINLEPLGWVLVSADDRIQPVLAYSFRSAFDPNRGWNDAASYLVDGYQFQIEQLLQEDDGVTHKQWVELADPGARKSAAGVYVDPIIQVNWNQGSGWNRFCPEDAEGPGGHAYVGCVAVAMAQAMSVYGYPAKGTGSKSYLHDTYGSIAVNLDKQEPYQWELMSPSSPDDYNARLLYHCAVTVEMGFGPDGSGAYVRNAAGAMVRYFSYSTNLEFLNRYADEEQWEDLLVSELEAGHPIVYRGEPDDGTAGHAWNVDGYGDGYFHMNFGWSGANNGYYSLNLIDPGSNDLTANQGAIVGITPPESGPFGLDLSATEVEEQLPVGSFVAEVIVEDEDPNNVYTYTCYGQWNPMFEDWGPASFYVENDTLWTAKVFEFNGEQPERNAKFLRLEVEDQYGSSFIDEFEITVNKAFAGPVSLALTDSSVMENQPVGSAVGCVLVEDDDTANVYSYTLQGPYNPGTSGYDSASFYVEGDSLRTSLVFDLSESDTSYVLITLEDRHGHILSRGFTIRITDEESGSTGVLNLVPEADLVFPNPADQLITVRDDFRGATLGLIEISSGRLVYQEQAATDRTDISAIGEGVYLVIIRTKEGIFSQRLVISR